MTAAEYIVDYLISLGATDAFDIPGVVTLDLLYAMDRRTPEFTPHLSYHEQAAGFAASGFAQITGKLGVACATRGPGFTNLLTAMADAYYDSIPVLFITAHDSAGRQPGMRIQNNQEMDTVALASEITKYAARVDDLAEVRHALETACEAALSGRKGPAFLDFYAPLFCKELEPAESDASVAAEDPCAAEDAARTIVERLGAAKRPVLLIGCGVRQSCTGEAVRRFAERAGIPVLSSRGAQDVMPDSDLYFGFVGSHATRYSNFILSKTDLIVALGNRMAFPVNSASFRPVVENAQIIRVDADEAEFLRDIPNCTNLACDLSRLMPRLLERQAAYPDSGAWLAVCRELRQELRQWDRESAVETVMSLLRKTGAATVTCDVGNHSFWVTNACAYLEGKRRVLYSNSFGTLGSALPKAIGACCAVKAPVMCFTGDQGLQLNIQELQYISQHRLPITLVVLNNVSSGMIRKREHEAPRYDRFVHTTLDSGYGVPDLDAVARAYGLAYFRADDAEAADRFDLPADGPCLVEVRLPEDTGLSPDLPKGNPCQKLTPLLPEELYDRLDAL